MTSCHAAKVALEPVASAVRSGREFVRQTAQGHVSADSLETAVLLASEAMANAVRHATTPVRLSVQLSHGIVHVEVWDDDEVHIPEMREPEVTDESGRGLLLVNALALRWGCERNAGGKSVWFDVNDR